LKDRAYNPRKLSNMVYWLGYCVSLGVAVSAVRNFILQKGQVDRTILPVVGNSLE